MENIPLTTSKNLRKSSLSSTHPNPRRPRRSSRGDLLHYQKSVGSAGYIDRPKQLQRVHVRTTRMPPQCRSVPSGGPCQVVYTIITESQLTPGERIAVLNELMKGLGRVAAGTNQDTQKSYGWRRQRHLPLTYASIVHDRGLILPILLPSCCLRCRSATQSWRESCVCGGDGWYSGFGREGSKTGSGVVGECVAQKSEDECPNPTRK